MYFMHKLFKMPVFTFLFSSIFGASTLFADAVAPNTGSAKAEGAMSEADIAKLKGKVAANINGEKITVDQVLTEMENYIRTKMKGKTLTAEERGELYKLFLARLVSQKLILQEAIKVNVDKDPKYQEKMKVISEELSKGIYIENKKKELEEAPISDAQLNEVISKINETSVVFDQMVVPLSVASGIVKALRGASNPVKKFLELSKEHSVVMQQNKQIVKAPANRKVEMDMLLSEIPDDTLRQSLEKTAAKEVIVYDPRTGAVLPEEEVRSAAAKESSKQLLCIILRIKDKKKVTDQKVLSSLARYQIINKRIEDFFKGLSEKAKIECFDVTGNPIKLPAVF